MMPSSRETRILHAAVSPRPELSHERNVQEIEDEQPVTLREQTLERLAKLDLIFPDGQLALDVDDADLSLLPDINGH